jgi:Type I restriction modification DNA specificity domain
LFESSNGNFDLQKTHINGLGHYVITAGVTENGILGKTDIDAKIFDEKTITIDMFGCVFFRQFKYKMVTHARVFSLKPKFGITERQGLFLANSLRSLSKRFGYENMCSWAKIKSDKIQLPIKREVPPNPLNRGNLKDQVNCLNQKNNNENSKTPPVKGAGGYLIDFDFMEEFIEELEAERIEELEAYLLATGLKDYTLTKEEKRALEEFESGNFKEFTYNNIFNKIVQGRRLKKDDQISGTIPFVMAGTTNTGVVNYISNPVASFPKNSITIDIFGNTFYRNYAFGAGDDTGVYWSDEKDYSKETMLFFAASMEKSLFGKFDFGKKLRSSQSLDFKINLPIQNKEPDYKLMESFISAIQKLVIKDVVLYADRKINATRQVLA